MNLHSMRSKILLATGLISALLTCAVVVVVRQRVEVWAGEQVAQGLDNSLATFSSVQSQREATLERSAALLAALPPVMAVMTSTDAATIQDASRAFWEMSGAQLLVLAGRDGGISALHAAGGLARRDAGAALRESLQHGMPRDWWFVGGRLFQVFIQPVRFSSAADSPQIGLLALGFEVDAQLARDVARVAGSQVAFCSGRRFVAGTIAPAAGEATCGQGRGSRELVSGGERFRAATFELTSGSGGVTMTVLQSYEQGRRFLAGLNRWIVAVGLTAILAGSLLAYVLSASFTRPLSELVKGVRALEAGNFDYPLPSGGRDEVSQLTRTFGAMRGRLLESQRQLLAAERLATIGQMATSISHDLRHPLTSVLAYAEFLSDGRLTDEQRKDFFREIRIAVARMTDELNSLLGFSKQGQEIQPRPARLDEVIERAIQNVRVLPEFEPVSIGYQAEGDHLAVFDAAKLERVMENLLFNACEAVCPRSGKVEVRSVVADGVMRVSVIDNGPGIPAPIQTNLFQPFVSHGKEQGIGLGLTVVKKIVEDHGGSVQLRETGPGGTVIVFEMPSRAGEIPPPVATDTGSRVGDSRQS